VSDERAIARRYAAALFDLYQEGIDVTEALDRVAQVAENDDAKALLMNTQIAAEDRARAVLKAASASDEYVLRLVTLLASRNKATLLPSIYEILDRMVHDANAQVMVDVTVAEDLDAAIAGKLKDMIASGIGKQVELNVQKDASILGGMILNIGDRQIDYSVRGRLDGLKRALSV